MPPLFLQNVIAVIWDFDKTLIPSYMQEPMFRRFKVDQRTFWDEANGLGQSYRDLGAEVAAETQYLNHILTYVRHGKFPNLSNAMLKEFGSELEFFPGLPDLFVRLKRTIEMTEAYRKHDIRLEHYVVSTGLRQIILGSEIAPHLDGVWACEFVEQVPLPGFLDAEPGGMPVEDQLAIAYVIDDTTKTRAIFEINKGTNKVPEITVNTSIAEEERRVPFENMIYVADGPSDVPVFSVVNRYGGKTLGVFEEGSRSSFDQVSSLLEERRVQAVHPADYRPDRAADMWLTRAVSSIGDKIVAAREEAVAVRAKKPPQHLADTIPEKPLESLSYGLPATATPQLVEDLLSRVGIVSAPVRLEAVLEELGIELSARETQAEDAIVVPMTDPAGGVPEHWMVYYNPRKPEVRRRYTIAHEIGHVLRHGSPHGAASARGGGGSSAREREADAFAAELLMPRSFMRGAVEEHGASVEVLRKLFIVSADAMRRRLSELGYTPA